MGRVSLSLHKSYLERTKEEASERAVEEFGEKDDELYYKDIDFTLDDLRVDEDGNVSIMGPVGELGWLSVEFRLAPTDLLPVIGLAVKQLNKFKTVLESLK